MQGRRVRATTVQELEEARVQVQLVRLGWGQDNAAFRRVFAMQFMPEGTQEQWRAFDELQRRTTSAANAVRFVEAFGGIDVTDVVSSVSAPSLVIHCRGDIRLPLEGGRQLAALLPDSRLVILDSADHLLLEDEPAWPRFLAEIDAFMTGPSTPFTITAFTHCAGETFRNAETSSMVFCVGVATRSSGRDGAGRSPAGATASASSTFAA